jgi:nucleoside-diphosphate-sugar epimerase
MGSVVLLGGTGQIGRAAAPRLVEDGWEVTILSRSGGLPARLSEMGVRAASVDRTVPGALERALMAGVDVVVDVIAFARADADQLNAMADRIGSVVAISSASVYTDDRQRSIDDAEDVDSFPELPEPTTEKQPTVAPSERNYSTRKVAMEQSLLEGPLLTTIIRPGAIHGPGSALPRELFFVKRVMDARRTVVLVDNGQSRFHTTSAQNLGEMIRLAVRKPGSGILNCGDPHPPTVQSIGRTVAAVLNHSFEEVLIPQPGYERRDLSNPWAVPRPIVVDMSLAAELLSYHAVTTYEDAVGETCDWLVAEARQRNWSNTYLTEFFNYAAEDRLVTPVKL